MPKYIKGIGGQKPPEPNATRADIDAWVNDQSTRLQPIVDEIDSTIQSVMPKAQYAIKAHRALYGLPKYGWMIHVVPYSVSVNVLFFGGADFKSQPPLGEVDRTRYVKLHTLEEAQHPDLLKWIKQAARTSGWQ